MFKFKPGKYLDHLLIHITPLKKKPPGLVEAADNAKKAWKQALDYLNYIDNTFIDFAVHNINATERRYMALVQQAKLEGITAWPEPLSDPVLATNGNTGDGGQARHRKAANSHLQPGRLPARGTELDGR